MFEKRISGALVYSGNFLKVQKDTIETSKGVVATREFIRHPGASLVIPILASGDLVMMNQYRYAPGRAYLEFPAGKLDPGETPEQTALRELQEEVQYTAKKLRKLTQIDPCIGYSDEVIHLFVAEGLSVFVAQSDPDEVIEPLTLSPRALRERLFQHEIPDVKTQVAAWWYLREAGLLGE